MSRWRIVVVLCFLILPFAVLAGIGSVYLWSINYGFLSWFGIVLLMGTGYFLAYRWQSKRLLLKSPDFETPPHWTERDGQALLVVKARAEEASRIDSTQFVKADFYFKTAQEMAYELASFYHPGAKDPISNLTVPEVLAVIELAAHDLAGMVDRYLPGGHLMTIKDWQRAKLATDWFASLNNLYWAVAAVFNPVDAAVRFVGSRMGVTTPMQMLQKNLQLWFYVAFVERVGHYLIEVHSGRLRVGTKRYLELLQQRLPAQSTIIAPTAATDPAEQIQQITLTLIGQVKAGKSSLVNALLGEQRARTDVLPATEGIDRYELKSPGINTTLVLLDTVGYGHTGPKADQLRATQEAAQQSDLLLLVLHATNPGRQADLDMLKALRAWFASKPDLKKPPILAVVTHIDLLRPSMEWAPPYNWQQPTRPKEESIHEALLAVRDQVGDFLNGIVPVCVAQGKVYGIDQFLLPAVGSLVDVAHGVALLRCLKAEMDTGKIRKVFRQFMDSGSEAARFVWQKIKK